MRRRRTLKYGHSVVSVVGSLRCRLVSLCGCCLPRVVFASFAPLGAWGRVALGAVLALTVAMLAGLAFVLERRSARDLEEALKRLRRPEYFSRYEALSARLAEDFGEDETSSHATGVSETWITEAVATVKAYEPLFAAYKERIEDDPDWEQFRWPDHSRGEPSAEVREAGRRGAA